MIKAEVIAHSIHAKHRHELITFVCTFPRIVLAEAKTHRLMADGVHVEFNDVGLNDEIGFSRNSASSRAIPTVKMLQSLRENPFIPMAWQKEHKGMQGTEYITDPEAIKIEVDNWMEDLRYALASAERRLSRGVTKQIANRPLETFMWHTAIITTSKEILDNFFELRCPQYPVGPDRYNETEVLYKSRIELQEKQFRKVIDDWTNDEMYWLTHNRGQAEIHMMKLAECMYDAYRTSKPIEKQPGEWHIPYEKEIFVHFGEEPFILNAPKIPDAAYISSVMCARVSYTVPEHELSEWTYDKYLKKAIQLIIARPLHASPFEHCGPAMSDAQYYTNVKGEVPYLIQLSSNGVAEKRNWINDEVFGWNRNFRGFIQMRDIIEKEAQQIKNTIQAERN